MIKSAHHKLCFLTVLFCLVGSAFAQNQQTIIRSSADYGMKCDGNTDDTQRFMNALGTGGGTINLYITFVNGVCNIGWVNPITVPSYVTLDFTQQGSLFLKAGTTLNVNGAIFETDYHPVFTGPGTYNLAPRNPINCVAITGGIACTGGGTATLPTTNQGSVLASQGVGVTTTFQTKPTFDVRDSATGFDCTGTTAMDTGMQSISSTAHILVPLGCIVRFSSAHTYPQTIEFSQGGQFKPDTGVLLTLTGPIIAPLNQIFANANSGQGGIDFTGNFSVTTFYPEWWGCTYNGGAAACNGGIQAAIYASNGCATSPATACRTNATAGPKYNRTLWFSNLYCVNVEMKVYHMIGGRWQGETDHALGSGIQQCAGGGSNLRILDMQSVAYSTFRDLTFENSTGATNTNALVDLDYSAAQGVDLAVQNDTFEHVTFVGNSQTDVGLLLNKTGSTSQGDNVRCVFCFFNGFTGAGYQIGGNNTGRNAGRNYAQNALNQQIIGGDMQGNPLYGVAVYGGTITVDNMTFENNLGGGNAGAANFQTGYDLYCEAPAGSVPCQANFIRSESLRLAAGGPWSIKDSYMGSNWAATFDTVAGNSEPLNQLITGTWVGGDGKYYKVTVSGTFGGLALTTATSGSSTTIVVSGGTFTTNAFVGYKASIMQGTDAGCYGIVTSNNATTVTFSAGLVTDYDYHSGITCTSSPDATSKFVVEPNWGTQTTSGGATFALFDFNVIDGPFNNGTVGLNYVINNLRPANGGRINATGTFTDINVTRTDWGPLVASGAWDQLATPATLQNVRVVRIGAPNNNDIVPYSLPRVNITGLKEYTQRLEGSQPLCWVAGQGDATHSTTDICINPDGSLGSNLGRFQILNNSSGTLRTWNFNTDGSITLPAGLIGTTTLINGGNAGTATGITFSATNQMGFVSNSTTCINLHPTFGIEENCGISNFSSGALIYHPTTAPTISTHFNTSGDSIVANGTLSFTITVGTGAGTSTGAIALPTAATAWTCWLTNQSRADQIQQTATGTASATFTNFGTTFSATNWTNGDILNGGCTAR